MMTAQRSDEAGEQGSAARHFGYHDVFIVGMRATANGTEAVQNARTRPCGNIAIGRATHARITERTDPELGGDVLGQLIEGSRATRLQRWMRGSGNDLQPSAGKPGP
jgi:hypothetical protein